MQKKIGDLTLREIDNLLKSISGHLDRCDNCPFKGIECDHLCEIREGINFDLDQEIEVLKWID